MEMLQLRYFFDSAKTENFAKTAEKYLVPTTSVSAAVKRLENELGCKLFDRSSNRILLNDNGRRLQQSLCLIFDELNSVTSKLSDPSTDKREIKMLVRAMRRQITDDIIEYNRKHPNIAFKTVFDFGETDFENYDIIIDEKTDRYPTYETFELCNMRIRLKVASDNPLCGRQLTMRQLCNQPFVSIGEQSNMHRLLLNACHKAGFFPNVAVMSNDIACYEKFIRSGMGIGLSKERPQNATDQTAYLDVTDFDERYTVYAYYRKDAAYGNVKSFLDFLHSKAT